MKKLAELTDYLTRLDLVAAEDIDGWVQDFTSIQPKITQAGLGAYTLFRASYTAVFVIDNFPHKRIKPELLLAYIVCWLYDNDSDRLDREDAPIRASVDIYDDRAALIEISIDFVEDVSIVPNPKGPILLAGNWYSLDDADVWYAEDGTLIRESDLVLETPVDDAGEADGFA